MPATRSYSRCISGGHTNMCMLWVSEGYEWRLFNNAQKRVRQDMVRLYGNSRSLIPQNMAASRADTSLWFFFWLQVQQAPCRCLGFAFLCLGCIYSAGLFNSAPSCSPPCLVSPNLRSPHLTLPPTTAAYSTANANGYASQTHHKQLECILSAKDCLHAWEKRACK